ncbi:MAG: CHAD domain-containing protein, partial [Actinomycetota bacterium]|nr:CHAD domain-containing protein [Actinomycetota bacterium]
MVPDRDPVSESTLDKRFRITSSLVLDERVNGISGLSKGLLDVTDTAPAESMWLTARRLRAAIELFRPCFSKSQYRGAREEVRALTQAVGLRRDLDVAIETVTDVGAEMDGGDREGIRRLVDRLRREQAEANRALAQSVHGRRMEAFRVRIEDLTRQQNEELDADAGPYQALEEIPASASALVRTRLTRLRSSVPAALDPDGVKEQHRMRVAAERLRYVLELTAEALGTQAHTARRAARGLQEILGEMRDCDIALPEVREQIRILEEEDVKTILERARGNRDLDPVLIQAAPNRAAYRGLELLAIHLLARRQMMFERFRRLWLEQSRQGVW